MSSNRITDIAASYARSFNDKFKKANELPDIDTIATGLVSFDNVISGGIGGMPRGRVVEGHGFESSCKSTWGLFCAAVAMKADPDFLCLWLDVEGAFDPTWAELMGVDLARVIIPDDCYWAEDYFAKLKWGITENIDLIVLDSIAAMVPKIVGERNVKTGKDGKRLANQDDAPTEERQLKMNEKLARAMFISQVMQPDLMSGFETRGVKYKLSNSRSCVYLINQLRMNPDAGPYTNVDTVTPGGIAIRHLAGMRLQFNKIGVSKEKNDLGDPLFQNIRLKCVKNKCGTPFRQGEIMLDLNGGFVEANEVLVDAAIKQGLVTMRGGGYYTILSTGEEVRGKEPVAEYLAAHKELFSEIFDAVHAPKLVYGDTDETANKKSYLDPALKAKLQGN